MIGEEIDLGNVQDINTTLTLPNGLELTFGQIVALAGDFFGVPDKPIIAVKPNAKSENGIQVTRETARQRFVAAYHTLAVIPSKKIKNRVAKYLTMIKEDQDVRAHKCNGKFHSNFDFTVASRGKMLSLAAMNFDHFQPQAENAYLTGHQLAIETAKEAANKTGPEKRKKLMEALSIDAFACHFLTDCFASGHIRYGQYLLIYK